MHYESHFRSILKAVSWRLGGSVATALLVFVFTRKLTISVIVGSIEGVLKFLLYFIHERFWNRIKFGKKEISPFVLWFTGVPYSGKTTIADEVYKFLRKDGLRVERLDSKNVRTLFKELGFSKQEVNSHIKRVGHLASILEKNGIIVVASFVSPYRESREFVRNLCKNFIEVHTKAPLEVCRQRHESSMVCLSAGREIKRFPEEAFKIYNEPSSFHISLDTHRETIPECTRKVVKYLKNVI